MTPDHMPHEETGRRTPVLASAGLRLTCPVLLRLSLRVCLHRSVVLVGWPWHHRWALKTLGIVLKFIINQQLDLDRPKHASSKEVFAALQEVAYHVGGLGQA